MDIRKRADECGKLASNSSLLLVMTGKFIVFSGFFVSFPAYQRKLLPRKKTSFSTLCIRTRQRNEANFVFVFVNIIKHKGQQQQQFIHTDCDGKSKEEKGRGVPEGEGRAKEKRRRKEAEGKNRRKGGYANRQAGLGVRQTEERQGRGRDRGPRCQEAATSAYE